MLLFLFKSVLYFILSLFILSFPIENKPLFYSLSKISDPYFSPLYKQIQDVILSKNKNIQGYIQQEEKLSLGMIKKVNLIKVLGDEKDTQGRNLDEDYTDEKRKELMKILEDDV